MGNQNLNNIINYNDHFNQRESPVHQERNDMLIIDNQ